MEIPSKAQGSFRLKLWHAIFIAPILIVIVYVALGVIADAPGFHRYGKIEAQKASEYRTNPWREIVWWLLNPATGTEYGTQYSMVFQPNVVDGVRRCAEKIAFGDNPLWYSQTLVPRYPDSILVKSQILTYGPDKGFVGIGLKSKDPPDLPIKFYLDWLSRNGYSVSLSSVSAEGNWEAVKPGIVIQCHIEKDGDGSWMDFMQWDSNTERWKRSNL